MGPSYPSGVARPSVWLVGDSVLSAGVSNGGAVSAWSDVSGSGLQFSLGVGTAPVLYASQLNGHSVVRFSASQLVSPTGYPVQSNVTYIAVLAPGVQPAPGYGIFGAGEEWDLMIAPGSVQQYATTAGFLAQSTISLPTTYAPVIVTYTLDVTAQQVHYYTNGQDGGVGVGTLPPVTHTDISIGCNSQQQLGYSYTGDVAEFIMVPQLLNSHDRQAVENYLNVKYTVH